MGRKRALALVEFWRKIGFAAVDLVDQIPPDGISENVDKAVLLVPDITHECFWYDHRTKK